MKTYKKLEKLRNILILNEQTFITETIKNAGKFLCNSRNEEGDWGYFKGFPSDLHVSSLSIKALRILKNQEFETYAEDATAYIKDAYGSDIDKYGVQKSVDLLNIISGNETRDTELEQKIVKNIKSLKIGDGWGNQEPSISLSCEVVLALIELKRPPQSLITQWIEYLVRTQSSENGGWGATPDSNSEIIPTSQALRVLNYFSDKFYSKAKSATIEFFLNYFKKKSWKEIYDIYSVAIILQTIGYLEEFPFEIIQNGIDYIYECVNPDGGWGATKGQPSNVEHTSLSMIALSSVDDNKFVPVRLVNAIFKTARAELINLQNERDNLLKDIDLKVQKEMKNIINERNELKKKAERHKKEVKKWKDRVERLEHELKNLYNKPRLRIPEKIYRRKIWYKSNLFNIFFTALFTVLASFSIFLYMIDMTIASILTTSALIVFSFGYFLLRKFGISGGAQLYSLKSGPKTKYIIERLISILDRWPRSKREDLLFRLEKEGFNISFEEARRYSRYLSKKYEMEELPLKRLYEIIYLLMTLPHSARLYVIDFVRDRVASYERY